jgi:hypothetical protein
VIDDDAVIGGGIEALRAARAAEVAAIEALRAAHREFSGDD